MPRQPRLWCADSAWETALLAATARHCAAPTQACLRRRTGPQRAESVSNMAAGRAEKRCKT
eukprot:1860209-Rhodomonas_salina.1